MIKGRCAIVHTCQAQILFILQHKLQKWKHLSKSKSSVFMCDKIAVVKSIFYYSQGANAS